MRVVLCILLPTYKGCGIVFITISEPSYRRV